MILIRMADDPYNQCTLIGAPRSPSCVAYEIVGILWFGVWAVCTGLRGWYLSRGRYKRSLVTLAALFISMTVINLVWLPIQFIGHTGVSDEHLVQIQATSREAYLTNLFMSLGLIFVGDAQFCVSGVLLLWHQRKAAARWIIWGAATW